MKKLILTALLILGIMSSCSQDKAKPSVSTDANTWSTDYHTIQIEGCDYILLGVTNSQSITHKGNCRNSIHK